jgi:hypothetical protein
MPVNPATEEAGIRKTVDQFMRPHLNKQVGHGSRHYNNSYAGSIDKRIMV